MLGGALLKNAEDLLKEGLHASDILRGYELALNKTIEILERASRGEDETGPSGNRGGLTCWSIGKKDLEDKKLVQKAIRSVIGSK